eukprot:3325306-Alexandrium_andersonii.AAC.1
MRLPRSAWSSCHVLSVPRSALADWSRILTAAFNSVGAPGRFFLRSRTASSLRCKTRVASWWS